LVIGVSATVLETLSTVPGVPTSIIPNAVPAYLIDRQDARDRLLHLLSASPKSLIVGQVARLHPGKGQLDLVELAPDLRRLLPDLRIVFVGTADPHEPEYERVVQARVTELGLEDCVSFLGHRDDAVDITAGCDALAIPSVRDPTSGWREGFPLSPLEAMSVGTPVVGYAEPAIVEEMGSCGALVPPADRERLLDALHGLLTDHARQREMRECGYRRIRKYQLPETIERLRDAFVAVAHDR
jgi:glycosyltransferase involved in cell wall biosynthesis